MTAEELFRRFERGQISVTELFKTAMELPSPQIPNLMEPCTQHQHLTEALTVAIARVRALEKERGEALKSKQIENARRIDAPLKEARSTARDAISDLHHHASEHGCGPKR